MNSKILPIFIVLLAALPLTVFGQSIYEPEGVNMPGEWNGYTNSNDPAIMGNFRMNQRDFGGSQYLSTVKIAAADGDTSAGTYQMLFTSGPNDNFYSNKWVDATLSIDGFSDVIFQGSVDNSITVENGFHYTFIYDDRGYENTSVAVLKTSAAPVSITSVSGIPADPVSENDPVIITVELNKAKSSEERIYVRYSTDEFQTSDAVEITDFGAGTTGTAEIPGQPKNAVVEFYALSTTIEMSGWNNKIDLATIAFENNGGANYSYIYEPDISPINDSEGVSITPELRWPSTENMAGYDLQLDNEANFSSPIINESNLVDTTYTPGASLDLYTEYFWRFKADTAVNWSDTYSFRTETRITFANVQFPESAVINEGDSATVYGQVYVPGITASEGESNKIQAWIGLNETNTDPETWTEESWQAAEFNTTAGNNDEYQASLGSGLAPGTYYYAYRYQYEDQDSVYGVVGGIWNDSTQTLGELEIFEIPELTAPSNGATGLNPEPELTWEASDANINEYNLQVSGSDTFDTLIIDETALPTSSNSYTVSSGVLDYETTYYWRVRAEYDTNTGNWSEVNSFTVKNTPPDLPKLVSPDSGAVNINLDPTLIWEASENAASYEIQVATQLNFESGIVKDTTGYEQTNIPLHNLTRNTTYFWRVRALNMEGSYSEWSVPGQFTTIPEVPAIPVLSFPADSTMDLSLPVTFSWNPVSDADFYEFRLSEQADFNVVTIDSSNIADTSLTVSSLNSNTSYYWQVRAANAGGVSDWSDTGYFTTSIELPGVPELINPEQGEEVGLSVRFEWNEAANADSYTLQVSEELAFEDLVMDTSLISGLTLQAENLKESTTYYWRVRGVNSAGEGDWSNALSFTTETPTSIEENTVPGEFALYPNYPNPFNPTTTIQYDVKQAGEVKIQVFDVSGRLIQTLVNQQKPTGRYKVVFDAGNLASGLYLIRMEAPGFLKIRKMALIK